MKDSNMTYETNNKPEWDDEDGELCDVCGDVCDLSPGTEADRCECGAPYCSVECEHNHECDGLYGVPAVKLPTPKVGDTINRDAMEAESDHVGEWDDQD